MSQLKWILLALSALMIGCATIGGTYDETKLKERVSYDTNCPIEKISIAKMQDDGMAGTGHFTMNACGKQWNYVRLGKSYFEESKSPVRR
jgi:hypothetical protein